ncbi:GAF domain-containing protein [Neobacillus thermocopriae]|uniref:GAF domain-containing protein n=1 Tax=Neobacillus thermocopriae TaxID=1215031 RepID=A0A6B3TQH8_9BACI|nr:GAF domain-containing protein [Neobacillus thermocopriae]MED3622756.1 GAF domain-containing protein [Neobacillus thermocopriae]MED3714192.1 GAF domain-containing protein [Neobacillus thermocopriae]NEX78599.1 GAF domain-containing protein [Neobacillus thermocopriae]
MFKVEKYTGSREDGYSLVKKQLIALIEDEKNQIANLSNASALLNQFLDRINWVGFYLMEEEDLVLGPFQGLPACVRIPIGKGVCGNAALKKETILVPDVHQFPGHIACDAATQSEIVIPMIKNGQLIGVLDIDSPEKDRFDQLDQKYLEEFVSILVEHL